ncbi:hypothetical protein N9B33_00920, partial [Akkermansiaceae bacterium]|nr:hypothetical protein [Akkermansiaceae bacterium]
VKLAFDQQGRLWSAQVGRGWFSVGGKRTALQYAEWDGKTTPFAIHSSQLTKTGFEVNFTEPLGPEITPAVTNYNYHYYSTYGSPMVDEKELKVSNLKLSKDRKTVTFDVPLTAGDAEGVGDALVTVADAVFVVIDQLGEFGFLCDVIGALFDIVIDAIGLHEIFGKAGPGFVFVFPDLAFPGDNGEGVIRLVTKSKNSHGAFGEGNDFDTIAGWDLGQSKAGE